MNKYKTIEEFLNDQSPENLEQIELLRELIKKTEPKLVEALKWNAPNYSLDGTDRITFNLMNKQNQVKLILHMGATKKEDKSAEPILASDKGIVSWNSDIRGTIVFENLNEINEKKELLTEVIKNWLLIKPL